MAKPPSISHLIGKFGGRCVYCRREVLHNCGKIPTDPLHATRDHFLPRDKGGSDRSINIVLCCFACNVLKGGLNPYEAAHFFALFGPENLHREMQQIEELNRVESLTL